MPCFDFKCDDCGEIMEFSTNKSLPKEMRPPKDLTCPKCKKGKLEKLLSLGRQSFDIVGYCYNNVYGKKAWKRNLTVDQQSQVLNGERDPY